MSPEQFVRKYYDEAKISESKTGISAKVILAQAALESAWGKVAPGNMFFGVKDTDGINGNEQLLITTEYSRKPNQKFPVVISVTPVIRKGQKWFKYKVKDYFRKYDSPSESFTDHCLFLLRNPRYKKALQAKSDLQFIQELAAAGYATDPNYCKSLTNTLKTIERHIQ